MEDNLSEKTFVITGATSGIGLATAELLSTLGAFVIGIGRSAERCRQARLHLQALNSQARITFCVADLSLQSQVRGLRAQVEAALRELGRAGLDGLVNDAGTFTYWLALTAEGFEMQWAVNHLAPFLLTHELLPLLLSTSTARIVTVSSESHRGGRLNWDDLQIRRHYNGLQAYQNTKLANVLFTLEFNRLMGKDSTVRAFAADPGLVNTEIGLKGTPAPVRWFWQLRRSGGVDPQVPARGIVQLLSDPALQTADAVYWKDGQPKPASRSALDAGAAARLWAQSERMCGISREE